VHPDASKPERVTPVRAWTGCRSLRFLGGGARIGGREAERRMAAVEGGGGGANGCVGSDSGGGVIATLAHGLVPTVVATTNN
jgi:hypothetical protein